jgi:acetylornithine deacetylase/succinyl-diaminopimelate desuccinylase-like protein
MAVPALTIEEQGEAVGLLTELLRCDTSNPPGNEGPAAEIVLRHLRGLELDPQTVGHSPLRPNVVARWSADARHRSALPLILSCHLDVVPADPTEWTHPPFSGHHDGTYLWGRGAIDMKGFAAMGLMALARLRREGIQLRRDVIFAAVADEESGTRLGSRWLVDHRPDLLGDEPEYVLNEVGGFTVYRSGRRFYPVQVAEKGVSWLRLSIDGQGGHSSLPLKNNAVAHLAEAVAAISRARLPWHPSPETSAFLDGMARPLGGVARKVAGLLSHPVLGPLLLPVLVPEPGRRASVEAILRNTATPTGLQGSASINSRAATASVDVDGRLAPGQRASDLIGELRKILPASLRERIRFDILHEAPSVSFSTDTPLYQEIEQSIARADPEGIVVPSIIPGFTDSQNYACLGAQCYGFYPLQLSPELDFAALFHGVDERIPVAGYFWGIEVLTDLLRRFLTKAE